MDGMFTKQNKETKIFKVSLYQTFIGAVITILFFAAVYICAVNAFASPEKGAISVILPIMFLTYYAVRAVKIQYAVNTSKYKVIDTDEKGLVLYGNGAIYLPYEEIKLITTQDIHIFKGLIVTRIYIRTEKEKISCYITNSYGFTTSLPNTIAVERLESNMFRW